MQTPGCSMERAPAPGGEEKHKRPAGWGGLWGGAPPGESSWAGRNFKHSKIEPFTGVYFLNF